MKKAIIVDTNIFIRLLVKDDIGQFNKAKEIFTKVENADISALVSLLVINEIIWILEHYYQLKRPIFIPKLLNLLALKNIKVIETKKSLVIGLLKDMIGNNYDFTDWYLSKLGSKEQIVSFDKDITRIFSS